MKKHVTLQSVLRYKNYFVVQRYMKDFGENKAKANKLFHEMLKFLWLCYKSRTETTSPKPIIAMYPEMQSIDNMWHTFILFTNDYHNFCHQHFGYYIHHNPNTAEKPIDAEQSLKQLECFLHFVKRKLGEKTIKQWFNVNE